jgi:heparanase 1
VDERILSFAVDSSQVAGTEFWAEDGAEEPETDIEPYDFNRPALRPLVAALAPAMLRIGGTDADHLWYDLSGGQVAPPEGFRGVIDAPTWDALTTFARDTGIELFFTLNAGPSVRDEDGAWISDNAEALLAHAADRADPVAAWELGNELNAFPLEFGFTVQGEQYGADMAALAAIRDAHTPAVPVMGPSVAYWPESGEFIPYMESALTHAGPHLDVVTWHYYPQQSERCPVQTRLAEPELMLDPIHLDEVDIWATEVEHLANTHAPGAAVWLGESGNAQCGGALGVSDTWASTFWFLDQLGAIARRGQPIMVRQTLSGSDYGMLDDETLTPRPDYWGALLWRTTMGSRVLHVESASDTLRTYAHCHPDGGGAVSLLAINLEPQLSARVGIAGLSSRNMTVHVLEADELAAQEVRYNGRPLLLDEDSVVPELEGEVRTRFELPPQSIGVAVLNSADAPACL